MRVARIRAFASRVASEHRLFVVVFVVVFAVAFLVRHATAIAYRPGLFWTDSWGLCAAGTGLALLFGSATTHFEIRYMIPAAPVLLVAGLVACTDLARTFNVPFATRRGARPSR